MPSFKWNTYNSNSTTTQDTFFRGDIGRLGQFKTEKMGPWKSEWTFPALNVGVHSASKSSPIVDSSGIYVGSDSAWFYAFSLDGSIRWRYHATNASQGIHSTALVDAKHVFFGTYSGWFYCFEKLSGELIWSRKLGDSVGSSPLSFEDSLLVAVETYSPNGYLVRIKKENGEAVWKTENLGEQSHSSPAIDLKNRQVVLGANNSLFFAFDLDSGRLNWKVPLAGRMKSTPIVVGDQVILTDWGREISSLNLRDGSVFWRQPLDAASQSSPAFLPKSSLIAVADKSASLWIFDLQGHMKIHVKFPKFNMMSSPVVLVGAEEQILLSCEERALCLFNLRGEILQKLVLDGPLTGIPFIFDQHIYLAADRGSFYSIGF